jgi:hypothetical protein
VLGIGLLLLLEVNRALILILISLLRTLINSINRHS